MRILLILIVLGCGAHEPERIMDVRDMHAKAPDSHLHERDIYKLFPKLIGVHHDLVRLIDAVRYHVHILVYEGCRTLEQQEENVAKGVSWTLHSLHLTKPCKAIDFVFVKKDGSADWTALQAAATNSYIKGFGDGMGIKCLRSGVSWDGTFYVAGNSKRDFFHIELNCSSKHKEG